MPTGIGKYVPMLNSNCRHLSYGVLLVPLNSVAFATAVFSGTIFFLALWEFSNLFELIDAMS
jgi:hypothetical protein